MNKFDKDVDKDKKIIPTYGKNPGLKMIGALDYITGIVYCEEHKRYDANMFLRFLENRLATS